MKTVSKLIAFSIAVVVFTSGSTAQITVQTVTVGNPGNAPSDQGGRGSVAYIYAIGTYEVTNTQYATFLNAVAKADPYQLYHPYMDSRSEGGITRSGSSGGYTYTVKVGYENNPVTYVSFWDAARFANWLSNGQGSASTETGSYTLNGQINPVNSTLTRNTGAIWVLPDENEWFKAAYYDPALNSGVGGYWWYPVRNNSLGDNTGYSLTNGANYYDGDYAVYTGTNAGALPVGTYPNAFSPYGTFDQGGNVAEWTETVYLGNLGYDRRVLGGDWGYRNPESIGLGLAYWSNSYQDARMTDIETLGFRVALLDPTLGSAIPEPGAYAAALGSLSLALVLWRRKNTRGIR